MASIRQGPEQVAASIVATLQAHLNAVIDSIWTVWAGGDPANEPAPPVVHPVAIYRFRRRLVDAGNYPVIFVAPVSSRQTANFMTTQAGAIGSDEERHRLFVEIGAFSDDVYALEASMMRYIWAVRTTLLTYPLLDGNLGGYGGSLDLGEIGMGVVTRFGDGSMAGLQLWGGVEVFVTVEETIQS